VTESDSLLQYAINYGHQKLFTIQLRLFEIYSTDRTFHYFSNIVNSRYHIYKTFFFITYEWAEYTIMLVPGKPFQPSLIFVGKAMSLPRSGAPEMCLNQAGVSPVEK
jgi:hypothetical protein